ncbi:MAG: DUF975 family protein [Lachnospiraceae bacterium]|nr:DUF975 family protein [Lachnospiraceae bacterium]
MFNRKEIKARAKNAFNRNYWRCVAVTLIISAITGGVVGGSGRGASGANDVQLNDAVNALNNSSPSEELAILLVILGIFAVAVLIASAIGVFLLRPFHVGEASFFTENDAAPAEIATILDGFRNGYLRNVFSLFLRDFLIGLGSIVIIPGIILKYAYKMVPYILADDPDISATDALKKSREMMKGSKWATFVLELSFIGWDILAALTLGILGVVYVGPYKKQALAEVYLKLSGKADKPEVIS